MFYCHRNKVADNLLHLLVDLNRYKRFLVKIRKELADLHYLHPILFVWNIFSFHYFHEWISGVTVSFAYRGCLYPVIWNHRNIPFQSAHSQIQISNQIVWRHWFLRDFRNWHVNRFLVCKYNCLVCRSRDICVKHL